MYWLYNKIKAQEKTDHNTKQGSSLWVNLVDVEQLLEDASVRNGRCGSDPLRWRRYSDVGFTQPTWVLAFAEKVATTIRNFIMLACYLSFFFTTSILRGKDFIWVEWSMFDNSEQHFTVFLVNANETQISLLWISSNWFQPQSDLFVSASKLKMYSNDLKSQNLIDISEKHMYIISRSFSVLEFTL